MGMTLWKKESQKALTSPAVGESSQALKWSVFFGIPSILGGWRTVRFPHSWSRCGSAVMIHTTRSYTSWSSHGSARQRRSSWSSGKKHRRKWLPAICSSVSRLGGITKSLLSLTCHTSSSAPNGAAAAFWPRRPSNKGWPTDVPYHWKGRAMFHYGYLWIVKITDKWNGSTLQFLPDVTVWQWFVPDEGKL